MSRPGASPLWVQLVIGSFGPPVMAILVRLMSRGWALTVQGGTISETTKKRQKIEFWAVLIVMYLLVWGEMIYAWLT